MFGRELGYFLTIVEEQSVSKAAARLFMSQPALSLFLGRLERQVGRKLFYRSGSGLILTHAGKCFVAMARKMEKASRDFEMQMSSADESFIGHLQIGTSPHIGSYVLPSVLPLFKKRYPNIEILLTEGNSKVLESLIAGNQLDAALLPQTAEKKVTRSSDVAGRANVLVFPNLHAGNIGVKLIQIFGRANAYGPVLQGFAKPVCDFSRSAPVEEMLGNVAMLVIRAGSAEREVQ